MSYEHRIEATLRASTYRTPVEPVRIRDEVVATGLVKSTALSNLDQARGGAGISKDRGGETGTASPDPGAQNQISSLTFSDLIDIINPLQHIPLVSNIYRSITGDEISKPAQVAGDALFFGPIGAAASVANLIVDEVTGLNMGDQVASLITGNSPDSKASAPIADEEVSLLDQPEEPKPTVAALLSPSDTTPDADREPLSPDQPFSFDSSSPSFVPETPRAVGFAGSSEPIALESLPADILAALYSGQPMRAADQSQGGETHNIASQPEDQTGVATSMPPTESAPRWSLWSSPDDSLASPSVVARAYGGVMPDEASAQGEIASQGGWFGANMAEILARYQDGANLQRQALKSFVDISQ